MSTEKKVWDYLKGKGFSDNQTAGIMGNIKQESGFSTTALNPSSGAYGLFQWLGGRKTALQDFAKKQGKLASDLTVQLDYFWSELQGSEKSTYTAMTEGNYSAEKYAEIFEKKFERSGGSAIKARQNYASQYLKKYGGTAGSVDTEISSSSYELVWWGDIVRVVFAIIILFGGVVFVGLSVTSIKPAGNLVKSIKKTIAKGGTSND